MGEVRVVSFLSPAHTAGLRALAGEADFAAAVGINMAPTPDEVAEYLAAATEAREDGRSYVFALTSGNEVLGVCRLIGVRGVPRLIVAVGHAYRGQGNGSFLVRHVLEFAFENLKVDLVTATGPCLALVSQFGQSTSQGLTRRAWQEKRAS